MGHISFADVMYSSPLSEPLRVLPDGLVDGGAVVEAGVPQRVHDGHGAPELGIDKIDSY